jgi:hypothetical protein
VASTAGAFLRRALAAAVEREIGREWAKWGRGERAGASGAQKVAGGVDGRRGRDSWRTCAGQRRFMGRAELIGGPTTQ